MSAMRIFTLDEFYTELRKNGFEETCEKTNDHTLWLHKESSTHFTVPNFFTEGVPDCILDEYLSAVHKLYPKQSLDDCVDKHYEVKKVTKIKDNKIKLAKK